MVDTFPTVLFGFLDKNVDIERQTLKGGVAISGEQDVTSTDGGGRVFAEFSNGSLVDRSVNLAWRAMLTGLEDGVVVMNVPFCDLRHQPYGAGRRVTHSDDTPFSDDALYSGQNAGGGVVAEAAALRATTIAAVISTEQPVLGGEWFSIEHSVKGWRAYTIKKIVPRAGSNIVDLTFAPPLRQAVAGGQAMDLITPRCAMTQDTNGGKGIQSNRLGIAAIRFVEAP